MRKGLSFAEAGRIGYLKSEKTIKELKEKRIIKYNENPKICPFCKNAISYNKRRSKFCGHSCAAAFNNKGVRRHGMDPSNCIVCGIKLKSSHLKYCSHKCNKEFLYRTYIEKIKIGEITGISGKFQTSEHVYRYIKERDGHICSICKNTEWINNPIPLNLDHIDGNWSNNKPENLRYVCPNCDRFSPTYGIRNKGNGRAFRRKNNLVP